MLEAIIFDLDFTLYDQDEYTFQGFAAVAGKIVKDFGLPEKNMGAVNSLLRQFFVSGQDRIFNAVLEKLFTGLSKDKINEYVENELLFFYKMFPRRLRLYDDASHFLKAVKSTRIKTALLTHGNPINQLSKIFSLDIYNQFDAIEITGNYSQDKWKPAPYLFIRILERLNVSAEKVLFIGDDLRRDIGASNVGIDFICIDRKKKYSRQKYPSMQLVQSFDQLLTKLE